MKVHELLRSGGQRLAAAGLADAHLEAELLLGHLLHFSRTQLVLAAQEELPKDLAETFESFLARRLHREPLGYVLGEWEFWARSFAVTPDTLIPRPETELLVEAVLDVFRKAHRTRPPFILDLGTGSGIIPVTLALEMPEAVFLALDRSPAALRVAAANAVRHGVRARIHLAASDWTSAVAPAVAFDAVVSNPPYIASPDLAGLQPEVARYEPWLALDGGADGLTAIRRLVSGAGEVLHPGGLLAMEVGADQEGAVRKLLMESGRFTAISCLRDYAGHERIVTAQRARLTRG